MPEIFAGYCDGGVIGANPSEVGGTWAYCLVDVDGKRIVEKSGAIRPSRYDDVVITNNYSEYDAMLRMLKALPDGWSGTVYSDSLITIGRVFQNWKCEGIPETYQVFAKQQIRRLGTIRPVLLDGHPTKAQLAAGVGKRGHPVSEHNVWCDKACGLAGKAFLAELKAEEERIQEIARAATASPAA